MRKMWIFIVAFSLFWSYSYGHSDAPDRELAIVSAQINGPIAIVNKIGFPYDPAVVIPDQPSTFNVSDPTTPKDKCKDTLTTGFHQFLGEYQNHFHQGNCKGKLGNYSSRFILFHKLRL